MYRMYQIDFKNPIHIHFMGIGGISMSGLAEILLDANFSVSGSDTRKSTLTEALTQKGATVIYQQVASNIGEGIQLVVYTAAIKENNPEYQEVLSRNIPMLTRAELLGQLMKNYKTAIAVSGTHGKTTTTSMIAQVLLDSNSDPTVSVGGILKSIHGNIRVGKSDIFITEACEYTNSFLSFYPTVGIILNIEEDHLDFFKDIHEIRESFHKFALLLPEAGTLIINGEIEGYEEIVKGVKCNVITYGINKESMNYSAKDISYNELACPTYQLVRNGKEADDGKIVLGVAGEHNISNSLATVALADILEIPFETIQESLNAFDGTERRFEYKGSIGGVTVIDDYAHHPTEIEATLNTAKKYPHATTWCVFQPHTYTRTKSFLHQFAKALSLADKVILTDIYAARETDHLGMHSTLLQKEIEKEGTPCYYFSSFDETENFLLENCINGDLLITMGAGDIAKVGENILGS